MSNVKVRLFKHYNRTYRRNLKASKKYRILINQGGTSSGKTYSCLQFIVKLLIENKNRVATVVGQDMPNLKAGAIRDFKDLISSSAFLYNMLENPKSSVGAFRFLNGSILEFRSYETEQDAKSGKRDYLFANEADGLEWAIFNQLFIRTRETVLVDYNPSREFWAHTKLQHRKDSVMIISNYEDNEFAPEAAIKELLMWKEKGESGDPHYMNLWKVYGLGQMGTIEGVVFPHINWINFLPRHGKATGIGLDFGFTNDPTAICRNVMRGNNIYSEKLVYEYGLTAADISDILYEVGVDQAKEYIVADSANPQDIMTLIRLGWKVYPAIKGKHSVRNGINTMKQYKIHLVEDADGDWKFERDNYVWKVDRKTGAKHNIPEDHDNHLWDAFRYWVMFVLAPKDEQTKAIRRMKVMARQFRKKNGRTRNFGNAQI